MSSGGSLSGITFAGLASGIDTDSIVQRLIQLEQIPLQRLQSEQQSVTQQQTIFSQLRSKLISFNTASGALNNPSAFNPITGTSSNTATATIATTAGGVAGTYNLQVYKLAQAQKISSAAQTDATSALAKSGSFSVNGKVITVASSDSLTAIAQKVNSSNAGVTASVINGGSGNTYLTFTSNSTGVSNKLALSDLSGSVLSELGVVSGAAAIREAITDGATSIGFSSNSSTLQSLTSFATPSTASFDINGITVSVDMTTANLQNVATAINAANTGATATVRTVTTNGTTSYKLDIVGSGSTPTFSDTDGLLRTLGVLDQTASAELVAAQDASYKLDTVSFTSASNTISDVIPGASITLLKANETTPETTTITLTKDLSAIKTKVQDFVDAYNGVQDFITAASSFDSESFQSGPLFGDSTAQQIESTLADMLFTPVPGLASPYNNLTSIGFSVDDKGKLSFDESKLTTAINTSPDAVDALFRARGTSANSEISYVSSTNKTKSSGAGAYDVQITQAATKGSYTAETAQSVASTSEEILTFNGALFGNTAYALTIPVGSTLADTVDRINSDSKLKDSVVASIDNGSLKIESKKYGTPGNFTVVSNVTAASDNSGIGVGSLGTSVTGLDVAGTINGEAATGSGQFLTGSDSAENVAGLQIQYTGTTTGLIGSLSFVKGMGAQVSDTLNIFTDSVNGVLTAEDKELQSRLDQLATDIDDMNSRIQQKQLDLQAKFSAMEQAISQLQAQGQRLSALSLKQ